MNSQSENHDSDPVALIEELHDKAMERYEVALSYRRAGEEAEFSRLAFDALRLEAEAARKYSEIGSAIEPGRTILFKGAAVIAAELKCHQDVIHLAASGLSRCEDSSLRQDLMRLLKQANFEMEILERDGLSISRSNFKFSIDGAAIGDGCAREDVFRSYLDPMVTVVRRTWQRLQGLEFNSKDSKARCPIYLAPAHGSMAVEFYLGEVVQKELPGFERYTIDPSVVVSEVVRSLDAVQRGDDDKLSQIIGDEVYRKNFVELSRKLLPNGEDVNVVKLVTNAMEPESVVLVRRIERQRMKVKRSKEQPRIVEVVGLLLFADGTTSGSESVGIQMDDGKTIEVKVPAHMMDDIVRPLWHKQVVASVEVRPKGRGESRLLVHCDEKVDMGN